MLFRVVIAAFALGLLAGCPPDEKKSEKRRGDDKQRLRDGTKDSPTAPSGSKPKTGTVKEPSTRGEPRESSREGSPDGRR